MMLGHREARMGSTVHLRYQGPGETVVRCADATICWLGKTEEGQFLRLEVEDPDRTFDVRVPLDAQYVHWPEECAAVANP